MARVEVVGEGKTENRDYSYYWVDVKNPLTTNIERYVLPDGITPDKAFDHNPNCRSKDWPMTIVSSSCYCYRQDWKTREFIEQREMLRELKVNDETIPEIYAKFSDGEYKSITDRIAEKIEEI